LDHEQRQGRQRWITSNIRRSKRSRATSTKDHEQREGQRWIEDPTEHEQRQRQRWIEDPKKHEQRQGRQRQERTTMTSSDEDDNDSMVGDDDSCAGDLQQWLQDDSQVKPSERTQTMITLAFCYVKDFSTDVPPYNNKLFHKQKKRFLVLVLQDST
jgi:hypothetical protein